jgi:hypothetical protein
MAESWKDNANKSLDDDFLRKALKAELSELKASDALIAKTLEKCREEVMKPEKPQKRNSINSLVFRYGGALAACLLVVVLAYSMGLGNMAKGTSPRDNASMAAPSASAEAGSYSKMTTGRASEEFANSADMGIADAAGMEDVDTPSESPIPAPTSDQLLGLTSYQSIAPEKLESIAYGSESNGNAERDSAQNVIEVIVSDFNLKNGTHYNYDSEAVFNVSSVADGGLSVESLKSAKSFQDLLGTRSYWVVPLRDQEGAIVSMLPFFSTGTEKSRRDETELNITYTEAYGGWAVSNDIALPYNSQLLEYLKSPETDEITIVDINAGVDFIVFLTRDGTEYGIPFMVSLHADTLVNGKLYTAKEVIVGLTELITPEGEP